MDFENERIVFTRPSDGGVTIVTVAENNVIDKATKQWIPLEPAYKGERLAEFLKKNKAFRMPTNDEIISKCVPIDAINPHIVTLDKIPTDRKYRNAWTDELDTDTIDIDPSKKAVIDALVDPESISEAISGAFGQLPIEDQEDLLPLLAEGRLALQYQNIPLIKRKIQSYVPSSPAQNAFISNVKASLGISD